MYYLKDMETGLYYNAEIDGWTGSKLTSTAYPDLAAARESRRDFHPKEFPDGIKIVRPKSKVHDWPWAWEQMRLGRPVRRASWANPDACLIMTDRGQVLLRTTCDANWLWSGAETDATDWVLA